MRYTLTVLPASFGICRLEGGDAPPDWSERSAFLSYTRTGDEVSVVCEDTAIPEGVEGERGWRCLKVAGPLDLSMVGVMAELAGVLARAGVSIFVVSTFETDYLLVRGANLARAVDALRAAGHGVE